MNYFSSEISQNQCTECRISLPLKWRLNLWVYIFLTFCLKSLTRCDFGRSDRRMGQQHSDFGNNSIKTKCRKKWTFVNLKTMLIYDLSCGFIYENIGSILFVNHCSILPMCQCFIESCPDCVLPHKPSAKKDIPCQILYLFV